MTSYIVSVGIVILAMPFLAATGVKAANLTAKSPLIVTVTGSGEQSIATGKRVRRLLMGALERRGHDVRDGALTSTAPGAIILRMTTESRILQRTYTTQATIQLRATLVDGDTKRFLARFDSGPGTKWRVASNCLQLCIDQEVQRRLSPLLARLVAQVDRRLERISRFREKASVEQPVVTVAFRQIDRSMLPQIEQYLQNFPGVTQVQRDHGTLQGVLYRISQNRKATGTELSLRKMLHHLQLKARVARTGNSFVVEANPSVQPAAVSRDW